MSISLNLGKWGAIFPVPNCVVDEEIKLASENQLKVLLFVLRNSSAVLTEKYVGEQLNILEEDVKDAILYWIDRGVLSKGGSLPQGEAVSEGKPLAEEKIKSEPNPEPKRLLTRPQKPDSVHVAERIGTDQELAALLQEIEVLFARPISSGDMATVVYLHDTVGLPYSVLLMLVNYGVSIGRTDMNFIERTGNKWANEEILTIERAEEKIRNLQIYGDAWGRVSAVFGIYNTGTPTTAQQTNANRWINEWHFTDEMLREAYERCVNKKNTFNITYTNGILKKWKKNNITNLKELKEYDEKMSASKKKAPSQNEASYDIEQYENFSLFDD